MPNDDLISRKALIEDLSKKLMVDVFPNWEDLNFDLKYNIGKLGEAFKREIKAAPAVDAEPVRHGKYEFIGMGIMAGTRRLYFGTCSECKERIIFESEHKNYCPNCRAKMDKEE